MLRDSDAQAEISTPNISIRPHQEGTYRITVHDDGTTYRFCCKNDRGRCAEYFCPNDEKSGCTKARGRTANMKSRC